MSASTTLLLLDLIDLGLKTDLIRSKVKEKQAAGATDADIEAFLKDLKAQKRQEAIDAAHKAQ